MIKTIFVAERQVPLTIHKNARAKRLILRIMSGGQGVRVTVPNGVSKKDVDAFLMRHEDWLKKKLEAYATKCSKLDDGGCIMLRGRDHLIVWTGQLREQTRSVEEAGGAVLYVGGTREMMGRRIVDFLKKEAQLDLEQCVMRHTRATGKIFKSMRLKDTKSRWGSCSQQGGLNFSWRIVMAPPFVLDYLAAHEVAHLSEMNHGPNFWALCEMLCPRMNEAKAWLKKNGSGLQAVEF